MNLAAVFTALDAYVLVRTDGGAFAPCNTPPSWYRELGRDALPPAEARRYQSIALS